MSLAADPRTRPADGSVDPGELAFCHAHSGEEAARLLESSPQTGLDSEEAARWRERYGPNVLTPRLGHGPLVRFLLQFHHPLIYILLGATIITAALQEWLDAGVIFGVVIVNVLIGFIQESKALKAIDALSRAMMAEATVLRGGQKRRISAAELVPGDIVFMQSGDKVPADLRLLKVRDLQVDESALTGESVPVEKNHGTLARETPLADRKNMGYASTLVTYGQGTGLVVNTGDRTEVGRISELIATAEDLQTPLTRRIAHFSKVLLVAILVLAALNFMLGLLRGASAQEMFMASVALAVAAIPEGLPAAVTITLAIGVARMAKRRAIIRKLPAVETLGSTTVICSDKTGTLTENQMTVTHIVAGNEHFTLSGTGYAPQGEIKGDDPNLSLGDNPDNRPALRDCLRAGLLCNDSLLLEKEGRWEVQGDPTEGALLAAASKAGMRAETMSREFPRLDVIPFESQHQYMATLHDFGPDRPRVVFVKGSVESVLQRAGSMQGPGGERLPIHPEAVQARVAELAAQGLRVLALARKEMPAEMAEVQHADVAGDLEFLGLQAMIDPPRAEAIAAVRACQTAGVRVKMITGDHALTASAIAGKLGLKGSVDAAGQPQVVTGQALTEMSDDQLIDVAERAAVFARVAPEQKLRVVKALQAREHIVAMTGDGVNDAPALKQANIGVAMGRNGTDVAREASDMVLTDDNFASIEAAVEEGRGVFDNLTKFITWTLPTNLGEGLVVLAAVVSGTIQSMPLSPLQILWINMTTAVLLGLMLAFEPKEPGIMERPPRNPRTPLLRLPLVMRTGLVSLILLVGAFGLFQWLYRHRGASLEEARTVAVNIFVIGELFYLFNCRSLTRSMFAIGVFSNKWALAGASAMVLLQLLFTYWGPLNLLFGTAPIGLDAWGLILGFGLFLYIVVEIEKRVVGYTLQGEAMGPSRP